MEILRSHPLPTRWTPSLYMAILRSLPTNQVDSYMVTTLSLPTHQVDSLFMAILSSLPSLQVDSLPLYDHVSLTLRISGERKAALMRMSSVLPRKLPFTKSMPENLPPLAVVAPAASVAVSLT